MSVDGADEHGIEPRRRWRPAAGSIALIVVALVAGLATALGVYTLGVHAFADSSRRVASARNEAVSAQRSASGPATPAPNGTFTTPSGTTATISSLRGQPTMVWFVAGGCASCAASIPAVASHLHQLTATGLQVLTLGLYGDFSSGMDGVTQLLTFGREATFGKPITQPGWEWGMASESLSLAYDPSGTPDVYVLIGPNGHIRYRNSVPYSTMGSLIAAAKRLDTKAHTRTAA